MTNNPVVDETAQTAPDLATIMRTLGQIARAVWPRGRMPIAIQVNLLARPDRGLKFLVSHSDFKNGEIDVITQLLDKVPATFDLPADGLSEQHQLSFWAGFEMDQIPVDHRIEVLDWREGTLRIHRLDGTTEETALIAISGVLHARGLDAVEAARRASIVACAGHHAVTSEDRAYTGVVVNPIKENRAAHGNITRVETCSCGAVRQININQEHHEQGRWR
jgi:hypothetical protein